MCRFRRCDSLHEGQQLCLILRRIKMLKALKFAILPPALILTLLMACGGGTSDTGPAPTATIAPATQEGVRLIEVVAAYVAPHYQPGPIVLKVGEPVQFKISSADTLHTFTIDELNVDEEVVQTLIGEAALTAVITPGQAGTLRIWCRIHTNVPLMEGVIQIVE